MPEETAKIVQLVPADGWNALYYKDYDPYYDLVRLISFALVEDSNGLRDVSGLDQFGNLCKLQKGFGVYVHGEALTDEAKAGWSKAGQHLHESNQKAGRR